MGGFGTFVEVGTASSSHSFQNLKKASNKNSVLVIHAKFPPYGSGDPFALSKDGKSILQRCMNQFALTVPRIAALKGVIRPEDVNRFAESIILFNTHCFFEESNCCSGKTEFSCPNGVAWRDKTIKLSSNYTLVSLPRTSRILLLQKI